MCRILGLGSPYGDDRVGWWLIDALRARIPQHVELQALDRPGAGLIRWITGTDWLIVVDALLAPGRPGTIVEIPVQHLASPAGISSHGLDLRNSLDLAQALGLHPRRVELIGILVAGTSEAQSHPAVTEAVATLAARLLARVVAAGSPQQHAMPQVVG